MRVIAKPLFLEAPSGRLFCVLYVPDEIRSNAVLICPPFAEELNRSRRMMALQARAMAEQGMPVLVLDLHGTGDSDGDFDDASWSIWRQDLVCAVTWLTRQFHERITLLGVRLGSVLALQVLEEYPDRVKGVVLWQPVLRGDSYMTQFLRQRLTQDMGGSAEKVTTQSLREASAAGEVLEIVGYWLSPQMLREVDALDLKSPLLVANCPVRWIDLVLQEGRPVAAPTLALLEAARQANRDVTLTSVVGAPFWNTPEIVVVPELIEITCEVVRNL